MKQPHSAKSMFITAGLCAAMLMAFAALAWCATLNKCATYDEPLHLTSAWLAVHEGDFRCDPEDPPLWKFYAAAGTPWPRGKIELQSPQGRGMLDHPTGEYAFAWDAFNTTNADPMSLLRPARMRMLLAAILLGGLLAWWGWRVGGAIAAIVAAALFCFDPNFMAHAPLMKNDVAFSLEMLALSFALWRLGRRISLPWFGVVSVVLALAMNTKFSAVLLIPIMFVLLLLRALLPLPWLAFERELISRWKRIAAAMMIAVGAMLIVWAAIWICYGLRFLPTRDPTLAFDFDPVVQMASEAEFIVAQHVTMDLTPEDREKWNNTPHVPSTTVKAVFWMNRHRLVPQSWLMGFLFTYANSRARPSFLWGQYSRLGWWYYFPLAMGFKTPLATQAALAGALMIGIFQLRKKKGDSEAEHSRARWSGLWLAACLAAPPGIYLFSAMDSHLNLGLRHVLPVYPFLFIGVGICAGVAWKIRPRITMVILALLGVGLVAENLRAYPDYIPFFNAAAGGERGGLDKLSDSNLDWGQDLPLLAAWQRAHPDVQLGLCYFGAADPRNYGIHYVNFRASNAPADMPSMPPGKAVIAVSATQLQGTYQSPQERAIYARLWGRQPVAILGGSIYIYNISAQ